ncbi:hypothetical protein K501DRAFT_285726 [Backusella circina FSU 941]|nr:hypothetical protein K501DRAFT_285726 [Backusella circina FSU 941]
MSSVSSLEGSDRDSLFHKSFSEAARHSYLRKTDLLDTLDTSRLRDTDTWSVAATIDDQESVISAHGGPPSIISSSRMTLDRETDDDRSTLDGESSIRDHLQDIHLNDGRLETLRDLADHHLLRGASLDDEEDKRSRSNAAEFGDDGARSATGDFDHSITSDDEEDRVNNNVMDDQISAPPQPQPSFASVSKSYAELMEENEVLQSQLRNLQQTRKLQDDTILNLRNLTGCDEEVYVKALNLSHMNKPGELSSNSSENRNQTEGSRNEAMFFESPALSLEENPSAPIINARTLTHKLARLAEMITRFANAAVDDDRHKYSLEQTLYSQITDSFLNVLPFGTENQDLLNIAYSDQIRRFHSTLGSNFAKWYRKQTVQSLSLNPATKEYLEAMRSNLTNEMMQLLSTMQKKQPESMDHMRIWTNVLDLSAGLSLEIHGGDADVSAQSISVGSKYDEEVMAVIDDTESHDSKRVKMVISPLFVDDEEVVLLPARVVLE